MLNLQLLGGVRVDAPDASREARGTRRHPLALLAYIAAAAPKPVNREKIMALLWPESDAERAGNSLRQALFWIRRDLHEDLVTIDKTGGMQLNRSLIQVDVWTFRDSMATEKYDDAVAAYHGAFMDGFQVSAVPDYSQWLEAERQRLERQYLKALDSLALRASAQGRHADAVAWRRQQAAADPFSARVALALLQELVASGNTPGALAHAAVYQNMLKLHLETGPDTSILEFVQQLRRPQPKPAASPVKHAVAASTIEPAMAAGDVVTTTLPQRGWLASRRRTWLAFVAVAVLGLFGGWVAYGMGKRAAFADELILGSGTNIVRGRDPESRLISCDGPACPGGALPQAAFVVPKHPYYTAPAEGTAFIAPMPDGTTTKKGYACCTTAVFEQEFELPKDAVSATILVTVLADNQASVAVNDVSFGQQADRFSPDNYGGAPAVFSTTFPPDPSGHNRLTVTLWDGRGALGLNYRATITYATAQNQP